MAIYNHDDNITNGFQTDNDEKRRGRYSYFDGYCVELQRMTYRRNHCSSYGNASTTAKEYTTHNTPIYLFFVIKSTLLIFECIITKIQNIIIYTAHKTFYRKNTINKLVVV